MQSFMLCLKKNENNERMCRAESKAYLQCRMDRELMRKEELTALGFTDE